MSAQDEIFDWVREFEPWKQELFLRTAAAPELEQGDAEEVAAILLGEEVDGRGPREVTRDQLPDADGQGEPLVIKRLCELENVNAIADGQILAFAPTGLSAVWGRNGAGKTGYSRILKHSGRTLRRETVLTNLRTKASGGPFATVVVSLDGEEQSRRLDLRAEPPAMLGRICVADARAGEAYLTEENEVDYVPVSLSGLSRFAEGLQAVRSALQRRRDAMAPVPLDLRPFGEDTAVARLLAGLDAGSSDAAVTKLADFEQAERDRYAELRKQVAEMEAMRAPELRAAALRDAQGAARLEEDLSPIAAALSKTALEQAAEQQEKLAQKREAAALAARAFADQPLGGVGGPAWRELWSSALAYAASEGHPMPPGEDHDSARCCPFCMQELDRDSRERLRSFERFVKDDVNERLRLLEAEIETGQKQLPDAAALQARHTAIIERLGTESGGLGHAVATWLDRAVAGLAQLRAGELEGLSPLPAPPDLGEWIAARRQQAAEQEAIEKGENAEQLRRELAELDARALLAERRDEVLAHLKALREVARIDAAKALTATNAVSAKITGLSQELISRGLEEALERQLQALDFGGIEVVPRTRTVAGKPMASLAFKAVEGGALTDVLSSGEQRRLALAMFLAELEILDDPSPVVLDDPTSSIDQEGRRHIAATLRALAESRQVIVFTHELSFIHELREAEPAGVGLHIQHVARQGESAGHVHPDLPWEGLPSSERGGVLIEKLDRVRNAGPGEEADAIRGFCAYLRDSFERTVEDGVLAGVITRRSDSVQTKKLEHVIWDAEICDLVDRGMSAASRPLHDRALGDGSSPPSATELQEALNLFTELQGRLNTVRGARDKARGASRKARLKLQKEAEGGRAPAADQPEEAAGRSGVALKSVPEVGAEEGE